MLSGEVVDPDLFNGKPFLFGLDKKFGADKLALAFKRDRIYDFLPDYFECAVDIAHFKPEQDADEQVVCFSVNDPVKWIVSFYSVTGGNIAFLGEGKKFFNFGYIELSVTVRKEDVFILRFFKPGF